MGTKQTFWRVRPPLFCGPAETRKYRNLSSVEREAQETPHRLRCCHPPGVQELLDLIAVVLQACSVRTFIGILIKVLDGTDGSAHLNIEVALIFCEQERVVRNDPFTILFTIIYGP